MDDHREYSQTYADHVSPLVDQLNEACLQNSMSYVVVIEVNGRPILSRNIHPNTRPSASMTNLIGLIEQMTGTADDDTEIVFVSGDDPNDELDDDEVWEDFMGDEDDFDEDFDEDFDWEDDDDDDEDPETI